MSGFWDKKGVKSQEAAYQEAAQGMVLDQEAVSEILEDPQYDVFEEEDEDTSELMANANLRLEQGRLYQMILENNIFADTNADPRAIKNVQREIRKFVTERLETMLGIRQEVKVQETVVSSPFNDLEVSALKMLASRVSGGATEQAPKNAAQTPAAPAPPPKKDGITAISGSLRPKQETPLRKEAKTPVKAQPQAKKQPPQAKSAIKEDSTFLQKSIDEMTPEELAEYNKQAEERSKQKYAVMPNNLIPHPTPDQLHMMYASAATQTSIANPPGRMRMY